MNTFYFYKSMGDVIYSLPAIQAYGGGRIVTGLPMHQYKDLKPLIDIQPLVSLHHESEEGLPANFINLEPMRYLQKNGTHIVETFFQALNIPPTSNWKTGWLKIPEGSEIEKPYAVINVTPRYRDKIFGYGKELKKISHNGKILIIFVGLFEEFFSFREKYPNFFMRYARLDNYLRLAQVISNAETFTGTQSSCLAIAEALGRSYRYERSPFFDNTQTGRPNETVLNNHTRKWHFFYSYTKAAIKNFFE